MGDAFRTGLVEAAQFGIAKNPPHNPWGRLKINGEEIVAFKGIVERAKLCPEGSNVEYNTGPTPDGKGKQLIHIKLVGSAPSASGSSPLPSPARSFDSGRQERIEFQSMLKVAAEFINQHPATAELADDAYLDVVFKLGHKTYQRFLKEVDSLKNPTQG